mgnify:CR=1 FL=1
MLFCFFYYLLDYTLGAIYSIFLTTKLYFKVFVALSLGVYFLKTLSGPG